MASGRKTPVLIMMMIRCVIEIEIEYEMVNGSCDVINSGDQISKVGKLC